MTTLWHSPHLDDPNATIAESDNIRRCNHDDLFDSPNLESSINGDGTHSIVLDLDCPHEYRPSSTPGHGHLVIPAGLSWPTYLELLELLARFEVLDYAWVEHAKRRMGTFVRAAGVYKTDVSPSSGEVLP